MNFIAAWPKPPMHAVAMGVRRLVARRCVRFQGFRTAHSSTPNFGGREHAAPASNHWAEEGDSIGRNIERHVSGGGIMSRKQPSGTQLEAPIRITCHSPKAREVLLAGTFNDWNPSSLPMKRTAQGKWSVELQLAPGRYEYKFLVDGCWCCDPHTPDDASPRNGCVVNALGTQNRILLVD